MSREVRWLRGIMNCNNMGLHKSCSDDCTQRRSCTLKWHRNQLLTCCSELLARGTDSKKPALVKPQLPPRRNIAQQLDAAEHEVQEQAARKTNCLELRGCTAAWYEGAVE